MKQLFTILVSVCVWIWASCASYTYVDVQDSIDWMTDWAGSHWYHLPVVRNYLVEAYEMTNKRSSSEKQHIAALIREVESISEESYRVSPRYELNESKTRAKLYGQIDETIYDKTIQLLQDAPDLQEVELVYVPWSYHDINNHKAWRLLRANNITTKINKHGFIASWWVDLLMSWSPRVIAPWAWIWVHAWYSDAYPTPRNLPSDSDGHDQYVDYFTDMGISEDLYRWTLTNTRPWSIQRLSQQERDEYWF